MRFILLIAVITFLICPASSQAPITENFDYPVGDTLTVTTPWVNHSGTANPLTVTDNNLTFTDYPPSTGNSTFVSFGTGSREDAHRDFSPIIGAGSVYSSFLINGSSFLQGGGGNYFFHLANAFPTTTFRGRVYVRGEQVAPGVSDHLFTIGVSKGSGTPVYESTMRTAGTTYLVVMKYTFNAGADDDTVDLYIFEDGDDISMEPGVPDLSSTDVQSDLTEVGNISLRQSGDVFGLTVDGIRVATTWSQIVGTDGGFPVTISCALNVANPAPLTIPAAGQTVFFDFDIDNSSGIPTDAQFWLNTTGPVNLPEIGPISRSVGAGGIHLTLRLKMTAAAPAGTWVRTCSIGETYPTASSDSSFTFEKSTVFAPGDVPVNGLMTEAEFRAEFEAALDAALAEQAAATVELPTSATLDGSYPNPFNPNTTLSFKLPEAAQVSLVVFDVMGREVARLVDGTVEAGLHEVSFNASQLPSGMYFARFTAGSEVIQTQRLTLLK